MPMFENPLAQEARLRHLCRTLVQRCPWWGRTAPINLYGYEASTEDRPSRSNRASARNP